MWLSTTPEWDWWTDKRKGEKGGEIVLITWLHNRQILFQQYTKIPTNRKIEQQKARRTHQEQIRSKKSTKRVRKHEGIPSANRWSNYTFSPTTATPFWGNSTAENFGGGIECLQTQRTENGEIMVKYRRRRFSWVIWGVGRGGERAIPAGMAACDDRWMTRFNSISLSIAFLEGRFLPYASWYPPNMIAISTPTSPHSTIDTKCPILFEAD